MMHPPSARIGTAIAALLVAALPTLALAQQRPERPGRNLDAVMVELTEQLSLEEEQADQIRVLLAAQSEQSRELIEEARASGQGRAAFGAMRERMTRIREDTDARIKAVLSVEQVAEYEEFVTRRRMNGPRPGGPGGVPGAERGI